MARTTGTFLDISVAKVFLAVVMFSGLVMSQDDCDPKFEYNNTGVGEREHINAFGTGGKWGQLRRLSEKHNYVVISQLNAYAEGTYMKPPNVVGFYPGYGRWTDFYKGLNENFTGLCGTPAANLQHLEPVIFQSTEEQKDFGELVEKLRKENSAFFNTPGSGLDKFSHWTFPTGEFRRTDGVLVDPSTNTPVSYNGFYYYKAHFPGFHSQNAEQYAPFFTGFHCRLWYPETKLRCGLTLIEESDYVIPLCRYKKTSSCYKKPTYAQEEDDFFEEEWEIGDKTYYGYKTQKNFSEATAKCQENFADLFAFSKNEQSNKEIMKLANKYYEMVTKTPTDLATSCILTSGEFGPPDNFAYNRDLTFATTSTTYHVTTVPGDTFFRNYGFEKFDLPFDAAYHKIFHQEHLIGSDTLSPLTAAKPHKCCAYTHGVGLYPLHCSMVGYFLCRESDYEWEKVNKPRINTLKCECGKQQDVSGNAGAIEHPWTALLYFRFRAYSREVPALQFKTCAGTVINNKMILTSASCALDRDIAVADNAKLGHATADKVIIALNTKTQKSGVNDDKPLMLTGTLSQVHPGFFKNSYRKSGTKNVNWEDNIALVKIDEKHTLDFEGNSGIKIRPACVADIGKQDLTKLYGKTSKVTGWSDGKDGGMRTYQAKFVNIDDCKKYENQQTGDWTYKITGNSLCHEVTDNHLTERDGGAPLVVEHPEGKWQVVGTASSYSNVGGGKVLSLFTDVSKFANFINFQADKEGAKFCEK